MGAGELGNIIGSMIIALFISYLIYAIGGLKGSPKRKKIAMAVALVVSGGLTALAANVSNNPADAWIGWAVVAAFMIWRLSRELSKRAPLPPTNDS